MKARVLVDNIGFDNMKGEWGLSIYIETDDKKILLDTGASSLFVQNAESRKHIRLIDGDSLVELMIKHNVGLERIKEYIVYKIDEDYFADIS